jgi:hypothetical protein
MANDIDNVLEELRREVQKYVLFDQPDWQRTMEPTSLALLRQRQVVNSHLPIGWPTMPRGLFGKTDAYAKKIVRRLLRWYVNPIVDQQNRFNEAAVAAISEQRSAWLSLDETIVDLQAQIDELRLQIGRSGLEALSLSRQQRYPHTEGPSFPREGKE